jgi:hypothetical protein
MSMNYESQATTVSRKRTNWPIIVLPLALMLLAGSVAARQVSEQREAADADALREAAKKGNLAKKARRNR